MDTVAKVDGGENRKTLTDIKRSLPEMPGWSKVWVGSVYVEPPDEMIYDVDITKGRMIVMARGGQLIGLPICVEHNHKLVVGKIFQTAVEESGTTWVFFRLWLGDRLARDKNLLIERGLIRGLSMSHWPGTHNPAEVSLVQNPRRSKCFIIEAGEGGSGAEQWNAVHAPHYSPQFIISENVFHNKYVPPTPLVYQSGDSNTSSKSSVNNKMPVSQSVTLTGDGTSVGGNIPASGIAAPAAAGLPVAPASIPMSDAAPTGTGVSNPRLPVAPANDAFAAKINSQTQSAYPTGPSADQDRRGRGQGRRDNYQNDERDHDQPRTRRGNYDDTRDSNRRQNPPLRRNNNTQNSGRQYAGSRQGDHDLSDGDDGGGADPEPGSRVRANRFDDDQDDQDDQPRRNKRSQGTDGYEQESRRRAAPRAKVAANVPASTDTNLQRAFDQYTQLMQNEAIPQEKRDKIKAFLSNPTAESQDQSSKMTELQNENKKLKAERQEREYKSAIEQLTATLADMSGSELKADEVSELQKIANDARVEPTGLIQMSGLIKTLSKRVKKSAPPAPVEEKDGFKEFAQMVGVSGASLADGAAQSATAAAVLSSSNPLPKVKSADPSALIQMSNLIKTPAALLQNPTACQTLTDLFLSGASAGRMDRAYPDPSNPTGISWRVPQIVRDTPNRF